MLPGKPIAGNTASPRSSPAALLSLDWCSASASQPSQCNWSLNCPSLSPSSSSLLHIRTVIQNRAYRHASVCTRGLWQRLSMCLRIFPNSSGLTRAGSRPLVPSKLICCRTEKSSLHCCLLETLYQQPQGLCCGQQRGREESRYFCYWESRERQEGSAD